MERSTSTSVTVLSDSVSISAEHSLVSGVGQRTLVRRSTAEFIQDHVSQPSALDPALFRDEEGFITEEQASTLDRRQAQIWAEAFEEASKLAVILEESQKSLKNHDSKFRPISAKKYTLGDLMGALEANRNRYEHEDVKGPRGFLRKGFRKLGENASSFEQWLHLVPNSEYSTPVVGSFMVFLSMADRMHKVREDIFKMMTAVPADFDDLRDYLLVYREATDERLSTRAADVCTHIFRTLQHAMRFMGENPFKKVFKSLKLDKYEDVVIGCIDSLQESKQNFRGAVDKHLHSRVGSLFRLAKSSSMLQRMMLCEVLSYKNTTLDAIENRHRDIKAELEDLRNVVSNAMYNQLLCDQEERERLAEKAASKMLEMQKQESDSKTGGFPISKLKIPGFDGSRTEIDRLECLTQGKRFSPTDASRLNWMTVHEKLKNYITTPESTSLLIEGNIDMDLTAYTSVTSYFCARIAQLHDSVQESIALSYFCGLSAAPGRKHSNSADARGMMMSLLGQMQRYDKEKAFGDLTFDEELINKVKKRRLRSLYSAFESLLFQLPSSWTVVCILDSIEFYETQARRGETLEVVDWLLELVKKTKKQGGPKLKLLVTASKISLHVAPKSFSKRRIITCPVSPVENSLLPPDISGNSIFQ